jgi:Protein of unknown function (DUF1320)
MPVITQADLNTHIYTEILNEILRRDTTIAGKAIAAAESEAKMYLGRYDLLALFGDEHNAPAVQDEFLKHMLKDMACWYIIRLANPVIDYKSFRDAYENAIATLEKIMQGLANPDGWPYKDVTTDTVTPGDAISWSSNPKRNNYF